MLAGKNVHSQYGFPGLRILRCLALALSITSVGACGQAPLPPCTLFMPVYDAEGNKLAFEIVSVIPADAEEPNILEMSQEEYRMVAVKDLLYFPKGMIAKDPISVRLENEDKGGIYQKVTLLACRQRVSTQYGILDNNFDVIATEVRGRFVGCEMAGDWWIRATTLFGGQVGPAYEGVVDSDGAFSIDVQEGTRHIFVVGKGKDPIESFAFDVVAGSPENDVGRVDLAGQCP